MNRSSEFIEKSGWANFETIGLQRFQPSKVRSRPNYDVIGSLYHRTLYLFPLWQAYCIYLYCLIDCCHVSKRNAGYGSRDLIP